MVQSNKIFVGLANTECSLLKFFGEVLNGEAKQDNPRWAGVSGINNLLNRLVSTINELKGNSLDILSRGIEDIDQRKSTFKGQMEDAGNKFFDSNGKYLSDYSKDYKDKGITNWPLKDTYVLDIVKKFGKKIVEDTYTPDSFLYAWNEEFSIVAGEADKYLETAHDGFEDILDKSFDNVINGLNNGATNLDKITKPFTDAEKEIGDILSDYAGLIDKYGAFTPL